MEHLPAMRTLLILVAVLAATATPTESRHPHDHEGRDNDLEYWDNNPDTKPDTDTEEYARVCEEGDADCDECQHWMEGYERNEHDWGYGDTNGPKFWPATHPECGCSKQSPVALDTYQALLNTCWSPFEFTGYDFWPSCMEVINTGHAVELRAKIDASVSGGNLPCNYTFSRFHFHFGAEDDRGSEHTVNGDRFPAEVHLVHYLESTGSFDKALTHDNGVAVLSMMLELSSEDNPLLEPIVDALTKITKPGESVSITPFPISYILPNNRDSFFRYKGSLTTPECKEVVVWTVFKETIPISTAQLEEFRKLKGADGEPLEDNYRPTQELNGRQVYMS